VNTGDLSLLTAVIPISPFRDDTDRLAEWLQSGMSADLSVILVFDRCKPSPLLVEILSRLAPEKVRFTLGEFGGPGQARNYGLSLVNTDWVCFWDSDDLPLVTNTTIALKQLIIKVVDIGICEFETAHSPTAGTFTGVESHPHKSDDLNQLVVNPGIWRFIFRTNSISDLEFPTSLMGEDQVFLTRVFQKNAQVAWVHIPVYRYLKHEKAQLTSTPNAVSQLIESARIIVKELDSTSKEVFELSIALLIKQCITIVSRSKILVKVEALGIFGRILITHPVICFSRTVGIFRAIKVQNKREIHVILNGGLGNQLFELSAALQMGAKNMILAERSIGYPRLLDSQKTSIEGFSFPVNIQFLTRSRWKLLSKACNLVLRLGLNSRDDIFTKLCLTATSLLLSFYFKKPTRIFLNQGVGWSQPRHFSGKSVALIGYFQSYKNQNPETLNVVKQSMSKVRGRELDGLRELARIETPLIVHVRLADYLNEPNFGVPGVKYYFDAIRELYDQELHKSIWLFSDEIESAKDRIPPELQSKTRLIAEVDGNDYSSLIAMALGQDFVIANSTFSWWAARLSSNPNTRVIFPSPWFKGMPEPKDLIPTNWQPNSASYE
jgi:glycosyltransferase involved in cell wall biosynthesis